MPRLIYCDDDHEFEDEWDARTPEIFQDLDNQIEHLFIVPHELARYGARRSYWEKRMGRLLEQNLTHCNVLLAWEFIHRVRNCGALSNKVQALVETLNLGEACDRFHLAVDASKEAATRVFFDEFDPAKIPRACLDYFARAQEVRLAEMPLNS